MVCTPTRRAPFGRLAGAFWLAGIVAGFTYLNNYAATPGVGDSAPTRWPRDNALAAAADRPSLVMFVHPKCPCSRASLEELARITASHGDRVHATVVFVQPVGLGPDWVQTDLWHSARRLPGVRVVVDPQGAECRRFGATTSGFVVGYDVNGGLCFQGGITAARGHQGGNSGKSVVLAWLESGRVEASSAPVFGCPLFDVGETTLPGETTCRR